MDLTKASLIANAVGSFFWLLGAIIWGILWFQNWKEERGLLYFLAVMGCIILMKLSLMEITIGRLK